MLDHSPSPALILKSPTWKWTSSTQRGLEQRNSAQQDAIVMVLKARQSSSSSGALAVESFNQPRLCLYAEVSDSL